MDHPRFASPFPQTPTPGGSASLNALGRPLLTSIKPFASLAAHSPARLSRAKPHPLSQVSKMDSLSTDLQLAHVGINNDITLSRKYSASLPSSAHHSQQSSPSGSHSRPSSTSCDRPPENHSGLSHDADGDDNGSEPDEDDLSSFKIGLSSLSPPGIGRAARRPGLDSVQRLEVDDDLSLQGPDFSRDLSALSLSPVRRRSSAPTPSRKALVSVDLSVGDGQDANQDRSQTGHTVSGFGQMAREIRRDFEQITGVPSPSRSKLLKTRKAHSPRTEAVPGGTLRGSLPKNGTPRARRVFGSEINNGLKPPRLSQLHSARLASTPPVRPQEKQRDLPRSSTGLLDFSANASGLRSSPPPRAKPAIRIVEPSAEVVIKRPSSFSSKPPRRPPTPSRLSCQVAPDSRVHVPDVTGLTEALCSPEKAELHRPAWKSTSQAPKKGSLPDPTLHEALTLLYQKMGALEAEKRACEVDIQDLQRQLDEQPDKSTRLQAAAAMRMVQKFKLHMRRIGSTIEAHAVALDELNNFKDRYRRVRHDVDGLKLDQRQQSDEVEDMQYTLEVLNGEVRELKSMLKVLLRSGISSAPSGPPKVQPSQPGMSRRGPVGNQPVDPQQPSSKTQPQAKRPSKSTSQARRLQTQSENTRSDIEEWRSQTSAAPHASGQSFISPDEIKRLQNELEQEQSLKSAVAPQTPTQAKPSKPASESCAPRVRGVQARPIAPTGQVHPTRVHSAPTVRPPLSAPQPQVMDELSRGEAILNSLPKVGHDDTTCSQCRLRRQGRLRESSNPTSDNPPVVVRSHKRDGEEDKKRFEDETGGLPPQTVLVNILRDLEADFEVHRKNFVDLSETYRKMNPASTRVVKRKALAHHLKESVDTLEKKASHIKHLYELLHFKDLPLNKSSSVHPHRQQLHQLQGPPALTHTVKTA